MVRFRKIMLFLGVAMAGPVAAQDGVSHENGAHEDGAQDNGAQNGPTRKAGETRPPSDRDTSLTVVASGNRDELSRTGQPLAIIGLAEIERIQGGDIARILERLPGVTLGRNGGAGAFTGLSVRGGNAEHLLVLENGVRMADAASPAGSFDFGTLLPGGIGKIELLRGGNSIIWGSRALAGVMAIEPAWANGMKALVEYGGPDSWYGQAHATDLRGAIGYGLDVAILDSGGISAAANGNETDALDQWKIAGRARTELTDALSMQVSLSHVEARLETDGYPAPDYQLADTDEFQDTRRTNGFAQLAYAAGGLDLRAVYSWSATARDNYDPAMGDAPGYTTKGRNERAEIRGTWDIAWPVRVHFGAEKEWSSFATLFDPQKRTSSSALYAQAGFSSGGATLNGGLRYDYHAGFGGEWSFGGDAAAMLGGGWRLRASYGEGFGAPSLFQLLSDYGNFALSPERSTSFDAGLELHDRNAQTHFALSLFRRASTDLIDFISCAPASPASPGICIGRPFGTYDNIGRARAQGLELEGALALSGAMRVQGAYSYVQAIDQTGNNRGDQAGQTGNRALHLARHLARRPRHAVSVSLDWHDGARRLELGADIRALSASFDDRANLVRLDGYATGTIRARYKVTDNFEIFGRVENIWDEDYQSIAGFGTSGRVAYLGIGAKR